MDNTGYYISLSSGEKKIKNKNKNKKPQKKSWPKMS